jgi:hypothetical protein
VVRHGRYVSFERALLAANAKFPFKGTILAAKPLESGGCRVSLRPVIW